MRGRDVPDDDMPNLPWTGRKDAPRIGDAALEAVLAGAELPPDSQPELLSLGDLVTALTAAPASAELAGEAAAMTEFRNRSGVSVPIRQVRRRPHLIAQFLSAKAAVAAAAAVISVGGVTAAAYAGALPSSVQRLAHSAIGAPAAPGTTPGGPKAPKPPAGGHGAPGLCLAYAKAKAHGTPALQSAAFQRLVQAAGGADKVASYCKPARHRPSHPGSFPSCRPTTLPSAPSGQNPSGAPAPNQGGMPSGRPSGLPTGHPVAPPSCLPIPLPTGTPAPLPSGSAHPSGQPVPSGGKPTQPGVPGSTHPSGPGPRPTHS